MKSSKKVVVLTGAGISAESGIPTFRGSNGLWEKYRIEEVATPEAWEADPHKVLDFYNMRRRQLYQVQPNAGHHALAELEKTHPVCIITQNIDNLHKRAGSTHVLHLHGELDWARSTAAPELRYCLHGKDILPGDCCELGSQLRPDIVWFGEMVPHMDKATEIVQNADIFLVVGTSLEVMPAADLAYCAEKAEVKFLIDPNPPHILPEGFVHIPKPASIGLPECIAALIKA